MILLFLQFGLQTNLMETYEIVSIPTILRTQQFGLMKKREFYKIQILQLMMEKLLLLVKISVKRVVFPNSKIQVKLLMVQVNTLPAELLMNILISLSVEGLMRAVNQ